MEQQQRLNRLYWLTDKGDWELAVEDVLEHPVREYAAFKVQTMPQGIVGYAYYCDAPKHMQWTEYRRYKAGWKRRSVLEDELPKPILLMEMLQ